MARQRFIHPDLWDDAVVSGTLTPTEQLLFIGMFSLADDEGRILADPIHLRGLVFRFRDDITVQRTHEMRDRIAAVNPNVLVYRAGGHEYIQLLKWKTYQSPRYPKPSSLPPPPPEAPASSKPRSDGNPEATGDSAAPLTQPSVGLDASTQQDSGNVAANNGQHSDSESRGSGWDGSGWDGIPSPSETGGTELPPADPEAAATAAVGESSEHEPGELPYWQVIEPDQPIVAVFCRGAGIATREQARSAGVFAFVGALVNTHGEAKVMSACQALIHRSASGNPVRDPQHARAYVADRLRTPRKLRPQAPPGQPAAPRQPEPHAAAPEVVDPGVTPEEVRRRLARIRGMKRGEAGGA